MKGNRSIRWHQACCVFGFVVFLIHDDVTKWKHFPRYWSFVRGIHRSPVNSPHKGQWRGALMISLICARIKGWVNSGKAGDFKRHLAHCDVTVMWVLYSTLMPTSLWHKHNNRHFHKVRINSNINSYHQGAHYNLNNIKVFSIDMQTLPSNL